MHLNSIEIFINTAKYEIESDNYYQDQVNLYNSSNYIFKATVIDENHLPIDLSAATDFYCGFDDSFQDGHADIDSTTVFNDPLDGWVDLANGKISWKITTDSWIWQNYLGLDVYKQLYWGLWVEEGGDPRCLFYQQPIVLWNVIHSWINYKRLCDVQLCVDFILQ